MGDETLSRMVRRVQADARVPALAAAVHRADRPLWTCEVGATGNETPLDAHTQLRIGSVTKTFTAVLVMQCRDDGLLDLDDAIGVHLGVPAHGELTIRRLLSHTAGLQREPYGDIWDTLRPPDLDRLLAELARAERVLPTGRRYHYSNLALSLLGHMVGKLRGTTWEQALAERILAPLGLAATTVNPGPRAATGYLVDAYSDHASPEPPTDFRAIGPAAQLWSTASDMARWAGFLADPATVDPQGAVLSAKTVEEMCWPLTVTDEALWSAGVGLGLMLVPPTPTPTPAQAPTPAAADGSPQRIMHVGHYGAMPGFLASVYGQRGGRDAPPALGCAVLGSSGTAEAVFDLAHRLLTTAVETDPADIASWAPGEPAPAAYRTILGQWWGEGYAYTFRWRDGHLEAEAVGGPAGRPPSVFAPVPGEPDQLRTVSGRETGELLRLTRGDDGDVRLMHWATYRFTRIQATFTGLPSTGPV